MGLPGPAPYKRPVTAQHTSLSSQAHRSRSQPIDQAVTTAPESVAPGNMAAPGNILRLARLAQRLTLTQVSVATRIRTAYLEAIEDDDYAPLPSPAHARAFVHSYARYLATHQSTRDPRSREPTAPAPLDPDALVALYERQRRPRAPHRVVRSGKATATGFPGSDWRAPAAALVLGCTDRGTAD